MKRTRNKQIMTIAIIMVAIVGLGLGFAAFSSALNIRPGVSVNPDSSTFSVKLSSSESSLSRDKVKAVADPTTLTTTDGEIDATDATTISGLSVEFIEPGQSATYTFYARNTGAYLAYLNMIRVGEKTCTPGDGTNSDLVAAACEAMSISVQVGAMDPVTKTTDVTNHTLAAGSSETIIVTLIYDEDGARADGPFTVTFGDISLTYTTTQNGGNAIGGGESGYFEEVCTLLNGGIYELGSKYLCQFDNKAVEFYLLNYEKVEDELWSTINYTTTLIAAENVVEYASYSEALTTIDYDLQEIWGTTNFGQFSLPTYDQLYAINNDGTLPSWLSGYYWTNTESNEGEHYAVEESAFISLNDDNNDNIGVRPILKLVYSESTI